MGTPTFFAGMNPPGGAASGTAISRAAPAPLQSGDALIAFVVHTSSITAVPSGYSLVDSVTFYGGTSTRYLSAYIKTNATYADSAVSQEFTQASSGAWGMSICAVRPPAGSTVVVLASGTAYSNTISNYTVTVPALTASRANELFVMGSGTIINSSLVTSSFTGATVWDATGSTSYFSRGAYQARTNGQSNATSWQWHTSSTTNNGMGSIVIRLAADVNPDTLTETTEISESGSGFGWNLATSLADEVELEVTETWFGFQFLDSIAEALSIDPDLTRADGMTVFDGVDIARDVIFTPTVPATASDVVSAATLIEVARSRYAQAADTVSGADSLAAFYALRLRDGVGLADPRSAKATLAGSLSDTARMSARLIAGWLAQASDTVGVADVVALVRGVYVAEQLGIGEAWAAPATYKLTFTDTVRLVDSLRRFFSGEASDTVGMSSTLLRVKRLPAALSETTGVAETLTRTLVLRVVSTETVGIDETALLKQLINQTVAEGIELSAAYIAPGDNFTTWAINTRSGAVTEYTNYAFNSFGTMGHKYLGASKEGLFELNGDTDDGDDIVAKVRSGLMQMAGSRYTLFRDAYLGMRGDGSFVLRMVTGEGQTYNYTFSAESMASTKVPLGKGLRARYFAFELESTGQDFDLESIEFVPLSSTRRVS